MSKTVEEKLAELEQKIKELEERLQYVEYFRALTPAFPLDGVCINPYQRIYDTNAGEAIEE
jgi:hypothetical protein